MIVIKSSTKSTNNKEDFIKQLTNISQEALNNIIKEKGKKPKLIKVFTYRK